MAFIKLLAQRGSSYELVNTDKITRIRAVKNGDSVTLEVFFENSGSNSVIYFPVDSQGQVLENVATTHLAMGYISTVLANIANAEE